MIAICWHFAYGIWLFAAKWGITPGEKARKRFGWVCLAGGVALCVMGLASIWAFVRPANPNVQENAAPVSQLHYAPAAPVLDSIQLG
jgi:succinate dehydrogenase / fumarate reductase cytochrome b subunit